MPAERDIYYIESIEHRTKEGENKYKQYKNEFTYEN